MPGLLPLHDSDALARVAGVDRIDPDLSALLRVAQHLTALARLPAPMARGAHLFGATLNAPGAQGGSLSATGLGETPRTGLARCLGEAVETLSQGARPGDVAAEASLRAPPRGAGLSQAELLEAAARGLDPARPIGWVRAVALPDGAPCLLPASLVLRGLSPSGAGAPPLSLGCAAGPDWAAARRAAAFELFERAALAQGREAGLDLDLARAGAASLARLRGGAKGPRARLRDMSAPDGPPAMLARSDLGVGMAAGETPQAALDAALREMIAAEAASGVVTASAVSSRVNAPPRSPVTPVSLDAAIVSCAATGFPLREFRLLRPEFGVPVVKLVCFGLPWRAAASYC